MKLTQHLVFASNNTDKLREMKALLTQFGAIELESAQNYLRNSSKIGSVEIYSSYEENAAAKARLVNKGCHYPSLADDSGLEVDALGSKPGVHSRRFAKLEGAVSVIEQNQANIQLMLKEMKDQSNRSARFVCVLALVIEGVLITAKGVLEGEVIQTPKGINGFGYDSIFVPKGESRTLAEMTETEKNKISHRALALKELMRKVSELNIQLAKV